MRIGTSSLGRSGIEVNYDDVGRSRPIGNVCKEALEGADAAGGSADGDDDRPAHVPVVRRLALSLRHLIPLCRDDIGRHRRPQCTAINIGLVGNVIGPGPVAS